MPTIDPIIPKTFTNLNTGNLGTVPTNIKPLVIEQNKYAQQPKQGVFSKIWGGIKGVFTGKNENVKALGDTVTYKDSNGNVVQAKSKNYNVEAILNGVGAIVGVISGVKNGGFANNTTQPYQTEQQIQKAQEQAEKDTQRGQSFIVILAVAIVGLFVWIFLKKKK